MQFFDQHSSNFYSTAVQLLRVPSERLREFHEAISRRGTQVASLQVSWVWSILLNLCRTIAHLYIQG